MAKGRTYRVHFRRRREGKTDYRRRTRQLVSGLPRLVVRRSNAHYFVHVVVPSEDGDITVTSAHSKELVKSFGWEGHCSNSSSGYLTGYLCGKRSLAAGVNEAILDTGLVIPESGSDLFAVLKGAVDAGLEVPCDEECFPDMNMIEGEHLAEEAKGDEEAVGYRKKDLDLASLPDHFNKVIGRIDKEKEE